MTRSRRTALLLAGLAGLFALRVLGQVPAAFAPQLLPPYWPPMRAWYSGLLPYPLLLPIQLIILAAQARHITRWWRCPPPAARPRLARTLIIAAVLYAATMLIRYALAVGLRDPGPHPWWAGGLIPVTFHLVLAGYLAVWGIGLQPRRSNPSARAAPTTPP